MLASAASAQAPADSAATPAAAAPDQPVQLRVSGPRVGVTFLFGSQDNLENALDFDIGNVITQFGWQFERQFFSVPGGAIGIVEVLTLIGGLEQSVFIPTVSFLVGVRAPTGWEAGFGPYLSPTNVGYAFGVGHTSRYGGLNVPVNLALVATRTGVSVSLLVGFTAASQ